MTDVEFFVYFDNTCGNKMNKRTTLMRIFVLSFIVFVIYCLNPDRGWETGEMFIISRVEIVSALGLNPFTLPAVVKQDTGNSTLELKSCGLY